MREAEWLRTDRDDYRAEVLERDGEIKRLHGFLKHLKSEAQDRDDIKLVDEIDDVLDQQRIEPGSAAH